MFKNKNMDLLSHKVTEIENTNLELVKVIEELSKGIGELNKGVSSLTIKVGNQDDVFIKKLDEILQMVFDNKALLEKKVICRKVEKRHNAVNRENPFINRKRTQPLVVAIEDRNYSVK